jgi:hypothetical protein
LEKAKNSLPLTPSSNSQMTVAIPPIIIQFIITNIITGPGTAGSTWVQ